MSGEVANYVIFGLVSAIAVYILVYNREKIRLFFISASTRRTELDRAAYRAQAGKVGMEEYERQTIIDILKDQLAHSREANSDFERDFEKLIARIETIEGRVITKIEALEVKLGKVENGLGQINNRLDTYRLLLTRNEDNSRK